MIERKKNQKKMKGSISIEEYLSKTLTRYRAWLTRRGRNRGINERFFHFRAISTIRRNDRFYDPSIERIVSKETGFERKSLNFSRGSSMTFDATNLFTRRSSGRKREAWKETREK